MTEFKSTNEQINEIIETINSKLKNHKIKIGRKFLCTGIISTRNNKELSIFDMDYMDSDDRLKVLKILNNDIELCCWIYQRSRKRNKWQNIRSNSWN